MFERFTDRARRVVVLAQEEARLLNHSYIGTEHILLGLIREGEGVSRLKDDTELVGKVAASPLGLAVDAIDLRFVAQRAEEQGKDPEVVRISKQYY